MEEARDTLCVFCANACNGGCSWSENLEPVDGWSAEKTAHGYLVFRCPKFAEETKDNQPKKFDRHGIALLFEAMGAQLRDDYIHGTKQYDPDRRRSANDNSYSTEVERRWHNRRIIEKWIRGQGMALLDLADPDAIILHLRKAARMYEHKKRQSEVL